MITRMTAHQLREYVAGHMEPMRVAKLKQFRKTTSPVGHVAALDEGRCIPGDESLPVR